MPWQHVTEGINIYTIDLLLLNRAEGNTKLCMFPILLRKFIVQSSINIRHYRNQSIFYNDLKQLILLIVEWEASTALWCLKFYSFSFVQNYSEKSKSTNKLLTFSGQICTRHKRPNTSIDILTFAPMFCTIKLQSKR